MNYEIILNVQSLCKKFYLSDGDEIIALDNISFDLRKGDILGVIGNNGSGKSSLLKIISGVMKPDKGKIEISGTLLSVLSLGSGFHPDLSGEENIKLKTKLLSYSKEEINAIIHRVTEHSELGDFMGMPVKHYSDGMFVRLSVSLYLELDFDILVIDEILSSGDKCFQDKIKQKISHLVSQNKTIILVSHDLHTVKELCNKCLFLDKGVIKSFDETPKVLEKYFLKYLSNNDKSQKIFESNARVNNLFEDLNIQIQEISLFAENERFTVESSMEISIKVLLKGSIDCFGIVFFVKDVDGRHYHTDANFMRKDAVQQFYLTRQSSIISGTYPPFFYNKGIFSFGVVLTNKNFDYYKRLDDLIYFKISENEWEKNKQWSGFESYSRLHLDWK